MRNSVLEELRVRRLADVEVSSLTWNARRTASASSECTERAAWVASATALCCCRGMECRSHRGTGARQAEARPRPWHCRLQALRCSLLAVARPTCI